MVNTVIFMSMAIILAFINQINCDEDQFTLLSKRTDVAQEKMTKAISGKLEDKNARRIQQEITHFKDGVKMVEDLIEVEASKMKGAARTRCLRAKDSFDKAVRKIEDAVLKASKHTRSKKEHGVMDKFVEGVRGGLTMAGKGMKEFIEAVRPIGVKGIAIAAGVADAYEKAAESIANSLTEVSLGKKKADETPATSMPDDSTQTTASA